MESEEDEVSLVVEGDHLSALKLRVVWEERGKHPPNSVSQSSREVIEDHLWLMGGRSTMTLGGERGRREREKVVEGKKNIAISGGRERQRV